QEAFEGCYQRQIVDEVEGGRVPAHLRPQWSKLTNYAGRFALILHLLRCAEEGAFEAEIGADTVRAAWRLGEYLNSHLQAVHTSAAPHAADPDKAARAAEMKMAEVKKALQQWLSMKKAGQKVTVRGAYTSVWGLRNDHDLARQLMEELAAEGLLTRNDD